ncbi:MAG TPA: HlyD family efflux transporter periplasmic adaptor subunit [Planctomycetaceae bacterium]|nr:HlyD family efflux transporter periplasmic adaptor subunit [Planctomycetaceae bacterium]
MPVSPRTLTAGLLIALCMSGRAFAQPAAATGGAAAPAAQTVTIRREALVLGDSKAQNIPLRTEPAKQLEITAPIDGFIRQVQFKAGDKVQAQSEGLRFDDAKQRLLLDRAKANYQAAKIEVKIANAKKDADATALAEAHVEAAQAELKLAEHEVELLQVKIPFSGEVLKVHVVPGQYVRAGQPLMLLADTSSMVVHLPVDRTKTKAGSTVEVKVEQTVAKGKVLSVLPAEPRFEPLRDLVSSLATATVQIDNPKGDLFPGQTAYTGIIPLYPYTLIPNGSLANQTDGKRQVKILRKDVVRDIPVETLTQVGEDKVYVAGAFVPGDELIVSSSEPLKDGQLVKQQGAVAPKPEKTAPAAAAAGGF